MKATQNIAATTQQHTEQIARPEDYNCGALNAGSALACWPCYYASFDTPNPAKEANR